MKNTEFARRALEIAENYRTVYAKGMVGMPVNETYVSYMHGLYPDWYTEKKVAALLADAGRFGFDCVCLIKAILWGWSGDKNARLGGAVYKSNGVPDFTVDGMLDNCTEVSTDFSHLEIGEVLWMEGHVGIYVGDGVAVECTAAWDKCVMRTAILNISGQYGLYGRKWVKHGKLKAIEYVQEMPAETDAETTMIEAMPDLARGSAGSHVATLQHLLAARGYFRADGLYGAITEAAVKAFQRDRGLTVTGKMEEKDWAEMLGGNW